MISLLAVHIYPIIYFIKDLSLLASLSVTHTHPVLAICFPIKSLVARQW